MPSMAAAPTARPALDTAVGVLRDHARELARLPPRDKAALLEATLPLFDRVARDWVKAACGAKGLVFGTPVSGEEWLGGPMAAVRNVRLLVDALRAIDAHGRPALGRRLHVRPGGDVEVEVLPAGGWDAVLHRGLSCRARLLPGIDARAARQRQAEFHQRVDPEGAVSLVLGAGNVASIPPMDVLHRMFVEGHVVLLKMNPVNEWLGPFLEIALGPLVARGFLRIMYGGGDVGEYLCGHPGIDAIHITGSDRTHDRIVWGPPGPEQERRKRQGKPLLSKPITSELGNVSPVAIVPGRYTDEELRFQAWNVASQVVNNASFNCNAAKLLVTADGWSDRDRFFALLREALRTAPPRAAFYPGARERYTALTAGREVESFGPAPEGTLPWTLIRGLDPRAADEPLFREEPFCGVLSATELPEHTPAAFLDAAARFCNERVWGTLNAAIVIDPRTEAEPPVAEALERAIDTLRYGTVAVNLWPAVAYGVVSPPWGGHPSATLEDIQSGRGWVHNTFMLGGVEKSILRGPLVLWPKPAWHFDNRACHLIGERLAAFERHPRVRALPGLMLAALRG